MTESQRLGRWGEDTACAFLQMCGYRCLERRYRRGGGEIDLIMARAGLVVFVEVKTRGRGSPAVAEAWVDGRQLGRLRRLARRWIREQPGPVGRYYRFDLVAVDFAGEDRGYRLRHLTDIR